MKKKRKGSSLISVVLIFAVLFTLGTSIMAATVSDYKMRINQSKKVQNLYESESGLEKASKILEKWTDESITTGNGKVSDYVESLNDNIQKEKEKYKEAVENGVTYEGLYVKSNGTIDEEKIKTQQNNLFKSCYQNTMKEKITSITDNKLLSEDNGAEVIIVNKNGADFDEKGILKLVLQSTFYTFKDENDTKQNLKTVQCTFSLITPPYGMPYSMETKKVNINLNPTWDKAIIAGGSLINSGKLSINGDAYIIGENGEGIEFVGDRSSLDLDGKLLSLQDIKLKGTYSKLSSKDSSSIYTGSLSIEKGADNSEIIVPGQVYANNDLVLNGQKSNINIGSFYGINDIGTQNEIAGNDKRKNSSSIVINTGDIGTDSSLTIKKEAVLMGTAYINSNPIYQTGESVAVKGNYRAYSYPLKDSGKLNSDNVNFEYISPLQLANGFKNGDTMTFEDKSKYFETYGREYNNKDLILKGIKLPDKTISIGSSISNGKINSGKYSIDENLVKESKDEYYKEVNSLHKNIKDYINFNDKNNILPREGYSEVFYVKSGTKPVYIIGSNVSEEISAENIILKDGRGKGLIIVEGDLHLKGKIDFSGTIICNGNIYVENDGYDKNIIHSKTYVKDLVAKYYDVAKDVFKNNSEDTQSFEVSASMQVEDGMGGNLKKKIISTQNWKIIK